MTSHDISNSDDVLDSRDIIARIEELRDMRAAWDEWQTGENTMEETPDPFGGDEAEELRILEALASEGEQYAPDWEYGATLVRDSYFADYCEELVSDIGDMPREIPSYIVIDWEATARNIRVDYTPIEFDGVTYWVR